MNLKTIEYSSIVDVMPKESLAELGPVWQAFFWCDNDKDPKTCFCMTWLTWCASWENRPLGLCRCHTHRRIGGAPARQSFFEYDNHKDLKVCFLVAHSYRVLFFYSALNETMESFRMCQHYNWKLPKLSCFTWKIHPKWKSFPWKVDH